jgi:hypothetical protein
MLNEERHPRKFQNRKTIFTTVTCVVNVGKFVSKHENVTSFSVENSENDCMNSVPCMHSFVSPVEGMRREK